MLVVLIPQIHLVKVFEDDVGWPVKLKYDVFFYSLLGI